MHYGDNTRHFSSAYLSQSHHSRTYDNHYPSQRSGMSSDHSAAPRHMDYQNTRKALESTQVMRFFERTSPSASSARRTSARPASASGAPSNVARTPQAFSRKSCWENLIERTEPSSGSLQRGQYAHSSAREIESNNSKRTINP